MFFFLIYYLVLVLALLVFLVLVSFQFSSVLLLVFFGFINSLKPLIVEYVLSCEQLIL